MEPTGLEGTINLQFQCNGYKLRLVTFQGSSFVEGSKRTVVGLALGIAFFITGHGFANFERTLKQCLGISCISKNSLFIYLYHFQFQATYATTTVCYFQYEPFQYLLFTYNISKKTQLNPLIAKRITYATKKPHTHVPLLIGCCEELVLMTTFSDQLRFLVEERNIASG